MSKTRLKPKAECKTRGVTVWFTPVQHAEIKRRGLAERKGPSTWVRDQLLSLMVMP